MKSKYIKWILDNVNGAHGKAAKGEILFEPQMEQPKRDELYNGWQKAVGKSILCIDS